MPVLWGLLPLVTTAVGTDEVLVATRSGGGFVLKRISIANLESLDISSVIPPGEIVELMLANNSISTRTIIGGAVTSDKIPIGGILRNRLAAAVISEIEGKASTVSVTEVQNDIAGIKVDVNNNNDRLDTLQQTVWKSRNFNIDHTEIILNAAPEVRRRGAYYGFVLPIYGGGNHEIYASIEMPLDWNGISDFVIEVAGWVNADNDKKYHNLEVGLSRVSCDAGEIIPDTVKEYSNDSEIDGTAYVSFNKEFTVGYEDILGAPVVPGEQLGIRIRRIASIIDPGAEAGSNDIVVIGATLLYQSNISGPPV